MSLHLAKNDTQGYTNYILVVKVQGHCHVCPITRECDIWRTIGLNYFKCHCDVVTLWHCHVTSLNFLFGYTSIINMLKAYNWTLAPWTHYFWCACHISYLFLWTVLQHKYVFDPYWSGVQLPRHLLNNNWNQQYWHQIYLKTDSNHGQVFLKIS